MGRPLGRTKGLIGRFYVIVALGVPTHNGLAQQNLFLHLLFQFFVILQLPTSERLSLSKFVILGLDSVLRGFSFYPLS